MNYGNKNTAYGQLVYFKTLFYHLVEHILSHYILFKNVLIVTYPD